MNFFLAMALFLSFIFGCGSCVSQEINDKRVIHNSLKEAADEIQNKYNLYFGGISEKGDKENNNKYIEIGLIFSSKRYLSKNEARKMTLDMAKIILSRLNTEKNKPFLTVYPFTEKNIDISVTLNISKQNWDYSQIAFFGILNDKIYYWYKIPNEMYNKRREYEFFPEAQRIVEDEEQK